jgi:lipoprotein-anchoring transpeptidase ErfK/SrfK
LHLTAHSEVLDDYGGGPGRVAIHGRAGASLLDPLGTARSHGCVRVSNEAVRLLARRLVPGVPVAVIS